MQWDVRYVCMCVRCGLCAELWMRGWGRIMRFERGLLRVFWGDRYSGVCCRGCEILSFFWMLLNLRLKNG